MGNTLEDLNFLQNDKKVYITCILEMKQSAMSAIYHLIEKLQEHLNIPENKKIHFSWNTDFSYPEFYVSGEALHPFLMFVDKINDVETKWLGVGRYFKINPTFPIQIYTATYILTEKMRALKRLRESLKAIERRENSLADALKIIEAKEKPTPTMSREYSDGTSHSISNSQSLGEIQKEMDWLHDRVSKLEEDLGKYDDMICKANISTKNLIDELTLEFRVLKSRVFDLEDI